MIRLEDLPAAHPGRRLLTGRTPFFAAPTEPRCSYCAYVPRSWTPDARMPVLVAVHGTGRNVGALREALIPFADRHDLIVVTPLFPAGIDDPDDVHNYKAVDAHGIRFDLVLLEVLEQVRVRWNARVDTVMLCGHSGGGQFAHRFLYLHPERLAAVAVSAPRAWHGTEPRSGRSRSRGWATMPRGRNRRSSTFSTTCWPATPDPGCGRKLVRPGATRRQYNCGVTAFA
ncbi:hypothetical protein ACTWPT_39865 [Nonomuraea sp. 3N208]|uniref:hypothetical protein n=1 Tax=Nonomuraea sp. 3N208 TaxID=3457421 RepID=UPI003FD3E0DB